MAAARPGAGGARDRLPVPAAGRRRACWLLLLLGVLTAAAQYLLAAAYKRADATYLQPFGDLKVPLSALLGWILLGQVPSPWFWLGAAMILAASLFIFYVEAAAEATASSGRPQAVCRLATLRRAPIVSFGPCTTWSKSMIEPVIRPDSSAGEEGDGTRHLVGLQQPAPGAALPRPLEPVVGGAVKALAASHARRACPPSRDRCR